MSSIQASPLQRILAHENAYWSCTAACEQRDGWRLFSNTALPQRLYPNHAGDFRAPLGSGPAIAQAIIDFYRARGAVPLAFVDALATPHDLIACLRAAGFQDWPGGDSDLMIYVGPDGARASATPVRCVSTPEEREAWASVADAPDAAPPDPLLRQLYLLEVADPRVRSYLAYADGRPAAACELFSSDGLGRVEAVRTRPACRRRGLAAALVRQAVADSLAQNQLTYIYAEPGGDAQRLYARLGFRTVAERAIRGFIWR